MKTTKHFRSPTTQMIASILLAFGLVVGATTPNTSAVMTKYADEEGVLMGKAISTSTKPVISGGRSQLFLGFGEHTITTYRGRGGYQLLAHASGSASLYAEMRHRPYKNAKSKCYWYWAHLPPGGTADMNCWYRH
ncbi:MAG: hypothetical protein Q4P33_04140 [Flaviflexus sp.]|nr:hypothetical protein [Flaviflexus sp.]